VPAPAAAPAAPKVASAITKAAAVRTVRRTGGRDGQGPGTGLLLLLLLVPAGLVVGVVLLISLLGGAAQKSCSPAAGGPLPGDFSGSGSLGGVGGTGISRPLVEQVRAASPDAGPRVTPGQYVSTAYGPPWGGIEGDGITTSGGLPIAGGAPRWYMVATDPAYLEQGNFVYVWPNPFGWKGSFLVADTGGAILSHRLDFYDWRGRAMQDRWGVRTVEVTTRPIAATGGGAPGIAADEPIVEGPGSVGCDSAAAGSLAAPGPKGRVVLAPGADRSGVPTQRPVFDFLARVAGIAGRPLVITTGSNHSEFTSAGSVSDHWVGLAADLGAAANGFAVGGEGGTRIAAASLRAADVPEPQAWDLARSGGGHDVCYRGWRVQTIWLTGDHYDHVHIGLRRGCSVSGVQPSRSHDQDQPHGPTRPAADGRRRRRRVRPRVLLAR
jgi:3D (Asp-Asp-Asp) domain-containing protein